MAVRLPHYPVAEKESIANLNRLGPSALMSQELHGIIFSDLGQASKFMALEWVMRALSKALAFSPFPATLNLRPADHHGAEVWRVIKAAGSSVKLAPPAEGSCSADIYFVNICKPQSDREQIRGAVLVPWVRDYPADKIEVVAPVRLKEYFDVADGDRLDLEFIA